MPPSEPPMPFVKPDLAAMAAAVPAHLSHLPGGALKRWVRWRMCGCRRRPLVAPMHPSLHGRQACSMKC